MHHTGSPTWQELKTHVYHEDGALRDIYVRPATLADWKRWADFVNRQYRTQFRVDDAFPADRVDMDFVDAQWSAEEQVPVSAVVYVGRLAVHTYFYCEGPIENDISPREVQTPDDHEELLRYLVGMAQATGKKVLLTMEHPQHEGETFIEVDGDKVQYRWP